MIAPEDFKKEKIYIETIAFFDIKKTFYIKPNTSSYILEFRKEDDSKNNCYFSLADAMKVNYYYQFCKSREISDVTNNFDLTVDLSELKKNIGLMIENSSTKSSVSY